MPYTTQNCKDFLDASLSLPNTAWKRTSKKKNNNGDIIRAFECANNNLLVEVIEKSNFLVLGRQFKLNTGLPSSAPTASINSSVLPSISNPPAAPTIGSIFGMLASSLVSSVKAKTEQLKESINAPSLGSPSSSNSSNSNNSTEVNIQKVDFALNRLKAMFYECDWSEILGDGVEYVDKNGEDVSTCPSEADDFHLAVNEAIHSYFSLNTLEKKELALKAYTQDIDFFHTFVFTLQECCDIIADRNSTYIPYHIGAHFGIGGQIGFVDLINLIKASALAQANANLSLNPETFGDLDSARTRLIGLYADISLDDIEKGQVRDINSITKATSSLDVEALKVECEKVNLESITPNPANSSPSQAQIFKL